MIRMRSWVSLFSAACVALVLPVSGYGAGKKEFKSLDDAVMDQVRQWQQTTVIKPIVSDDGTVLYPFGQYLPTLTCGVMHACAVDLEPGESLIDSSRGDTKLWQQQVATSLDAATGRKLSHIIFKPWLNGIETNVMLFTDRRTYHIKLVSPVTETDYMNHIGFYYPDQIVQHWNDAAVAGQAVDAAKARKADLPSVSLDKVDWGYTVRGGDSATRPVRVGNDGTRVWIQMPELMDKTEVPTLVVLDDDGKPQDVNNRRAGRDGEFFIVDKLFTRAQLLWGGSDGSVTTVTIIWDKQKKWYW